MNMSIKGFDLAWMGNQCVYAERQDREGREGYPHHCNFEVSGDRSRILQRVSTSFPDADSEDAKQFIKEAVTAQVGWMTQARRRDLAKCDGWWVRASMMFQPCFLAVEKKERMRAKSIAPSDERKPPEIF